MTNSSGIEGYSHSILHRNVALFIGAWFGWTLFLLLDGLGAWLMEDQNAFFGKLSFPLDWVSPAFAITTKTIFIAGIAIFLVNTFVFALILCPVAMIFVAIDRRGRVIQLGINRKDVNDEDDEL